ncbi:MAG TPA: glycosyltransferase family 39 protein, partial [Vicinamibacteria bacterium]
MSRGARLAIVIGALYCASRLVQLTSLPIFLDEITHIRWAVEIASGEKWLRPWNYGKGLSIFVNALLFPWAFDHYLWASRALTVAFSAFTLAAGCAAARRLLDPPSVFVFALLYLTCPFALFYDRLALTDPPMATFAALALVVSVRLQENPTRRLVLLLALALVLAVLTKATALLTFLVPGLALAVLGPLDRRRLRAFATACGLALAALAWPLHR